MTRRWSPEPAPTAARRAGRRRGRQVASLVAWWAVLALTLWLLGHALGRPAGLAPSAASAALLVAVGEAGYLVRRWWAVRVRRAGPGLP
ncbi:hypothetical protein J5J01_07815 [Streptomyces fradiae]|uniref:hypothetical protein n=1 Tax=Streptomyces fradiae TaxID=1906 RepID=UPI002018C4DB|nr:hypothetical protein [Streptomyces fradiae]UQS31533.1 hypothetical protein J5J01_07815 [Streptomyces fradiae]